MLNTTRPRTGFSDNQDPHSRKSRSQIINLNLTDVMVQPLVYAFNCSIVHLIFSFLVSSGVMGNLQNCFTEIKTHYENLRVFVTKMSPVKFGPSLSKL